MDTESPSNEASPIAPEPAAGPSRRRSALTGAVLGVVALTASVVGVSAIAGAQDDPVTDPEPAADLLVDADDLDEHEDFEVDAYDDAEWAEFDECLDDALAGLEEPADDAELSDADWEAFEAQFEAAEEACTDLLPEDVKAEMAAWEPFDQCIDDQIGDLDIDESTVTDDDWEALDAQFEAAEEACRDLLPADALAELEAFEAFDQCLADAGFDDSVFGDSGVDGPVVFIETGDGEQIIEFGDTPGTVTITGDANGITVAADGVTMVDEADIDAAFETCEQLLPEDVFADEWGDDEWDDEEDEGDDA